MVSRAIVAHIGSSLRANRSLLIGAVRRVQVLGIGCYERNLCLQAVAESA
jgi:hypothetical protein